MAARILARARHATSGCLTCEAGDGDWAGLPAKLASIRKPMGRVVAGEFIVSAFAGAGLKTRGHVRRTCSHAGGAEAPPYADLFTHLSHPSYPSYLS